MWEAFPREAKDRATNNRLLQTAQYWRPRYQDQASPRPRSNSINYYGGVQARIESFLITSPIFSQCFPLLAAAPCTERKFCLLFAFHFVYPKFWKMTMFCFLHCIKFCILHFTMFCYYPPYTCQCSIRGFYAKLPSTRLEGQYQP